ncbi:Transcriptional regulatory protein YycF [compost metagenome]
MKKCILIIEDEFKISDVIRSYLEKDNFIVHQAFNGNEALLKFKELIPDLIILDLMLPDISGEEICKEIRKISNIPIIMLTAKIQETSILEGLNIGADDYITKPFSTRTTYC